MRWLAAAAFAVAGCDSGILACPGVAGGSDWICPGGAPNACALPPLLCSTTELVEACQVDGAFQPDYATCNFNGTGPGRCISGACEACSDDFDGCSAPGWNPMTPATNVTANLNGVYAVSSRDAYAVGDQGTFLHYDGTAWTALPSDPTGRNLLAIAPDGKGGFFAVNGDPAVYAVTAAGAWSTAFTSALGLTSIAATGPTVTAVGGLGAIYQFDGTTWVDQTAPGGLAAPWLGVWGSGDTRFAVGAAGIVVAETGSAAWTESRANGSGQLQLDAVSGTGSDDVYAVSIATPTVAAQIVHFDGTGWTSESSNLATGLSLEAVWAASPSAIFAAGSGALIQCDGPGCTWAPPPTLPMLPSEVRALTGFDSTHGYAVGTGGAILRYGGPGSGTD